MSWGSSGALTQAQVQAACAAAISAAGLPDVSNVQTAAEAGASAAITAANLPTAAEVATAVGAQAACEAAILARVAAGTLPAPADVETACGTAIASANLADASSVAALQTACDSLGTMIDALHDVSTSDVQTAAAAAITAASLATAAQVSALNNVSTTDVQDACGNAIANSGLPVAADIETLCGNALTTAAGNGTIPSANDIANAVDGLNVAGAVPSQVLAYAYGSSVQRATVTASAGSTTGTLITTPGGGQRIVIVAIVVACTTAQSSFSLSSSGGSTMGTYQIPQNATLEINRLFHYIHRSGSGASVSWNKTSGANLSIDVWWYAE